MEKDICCPKFDPKKWDKKTTTWKNKLFVKDSVRAFLHIPVNMGSVMKRMSEKVEAAKAMPKINDWLLLSDECSAWRSDQYMSVTKEVQGMENVKISGTFMTKVFEGPYKDAKNWYTELIEYVKSKGKEPGKIYFYYTTCPKCAKKYGKNYVVGFARV
jgi:effector-binding domain-containing protein